MSFPRNFKFLLGTGSGHDQNGEDSSEDDAGEDSDIPGENPSEDDADDPSAPSRPVVLQRMRQIGGTHGNDSAEWNTFVAWINSSHGAYLGNRDDPERNRQQSGSSDSELDDPDDTESDSSAGPWISPTPATDDESGSAAGQTTSSSSNSDRSNASLDSLEGVLTSPLRDSQGVDLRFSSAQEANAENKEIRDSTPNRAGGSGYKNSRDANLGKYQANRDSPHPTGGSGYGAESIFIFEDCLPEKSGEANSGECKQLYQPCGFIFRSEEQGEKICGSPIVNAQLPYCAKHMQQAGALERENVASSSGTSLSNNKVANTVQEEPKPSEQEDKPSS